MAQAQALTEATWTPEPSVAFLKGNPLKFHPLQYQFSAGDTLVLTGPTRGVFGIRVRIRLIPAFSCCGCPPRSTSAIMRWLYRNCLKIKRFLTSKHPL